jgi:hypothetical protein
MEMFLGFRSGQIFTPLFLWNTSSLWMLCIYGFYFVYLEYVMLFVHVSAENPWDSGDEIADERDLGEG